jgi:hypothetical protein
MQAPIFDKAVEKLATVLEEGARANARSTTRFIEPAAGTLRRAPKGADNDLVQELVDLRLIHHVRSRVTVPDYPGKGFRALLLDFSQYTGERKKRDVEMLEFWKDANKESLRRRSLVYDPSKSLEDLQREIAEKSRRSETRSDLTSQGWFKLE